MLTSTDRAVAWRVPQDRSGPPMGGAGKPHVSADASPWQALLAEATSGAPATKTGAAIKIASRNDWPAMGFVPAKSSTAAQQIDVPADVPAKGWSPNVDKGEIRPPFVPPKAETIVADASGKIPFDDDEAALDADEKSAAKKSEEGFSLFGKDGPSFGDIVDIINPFQHIPLLSNIYRDMLGDTISPAARIAGSALFFGPIGVAFAVANVALQGATGKDAGDHMVAFMKEHGTPAEIAVADAGAASKPDKSPGKSPDKSETNAETIPEATMITAAGATPAPVAALLPPGATPIEGRSVEFKAEALRPIGFAGPAAAPTAPFQQLIQDIKAGGTTLPPDADAKIVAPSPKKAAAAYAALKADAASTSIANPRPGTAADAPKPAPRATTDTVAPGATANGGGWFTDAMLSALKKYEATDKPANKPVAPPTPNAAIDVED